MAKSKHVLVEATFVVPPPRTFASELDTVLISKPIGPPVPVGVGGLLAVRVPSEHPFGDGVSQPDPVFSIGPWVLLLQEPDDGIIFISVTDFSKLASVQLAKLKCKQKI